MSAQASGSMSEGRVELDLRLAGLPSAFTAPPYEEADASGVFRPSISATAAVSSGVRTAPSGTSAWSDSRSRSRFSASVFASSSKKVPQQSLLWMLSRGCRWEWALPNVRHAQDHLCRQ